MLYVYGCFGEINYDDDKCMCKQDNSQSLTDFSVVFWVEGISVENDPDHIPESFWVILCDFQFLFK